MNARIENMMTELMRDVFEAQTAPDAILAAKVDEVKTATEVTAPLYSIKVKSTTTKGKVKEYSATKLSADPVRNVQLLNIALTEIASAKDAATAAAIREMMIAIINTF